MQESYDSIGRYINVDSQLQLGSITLIRSGAYSYSSGGISARSSYGYFWEATPYSATNTRSLYFSSVYLTPQASGYGKGYGFIVRCLVR